MRRAPFDRLSYLRQGYHRLIAYDQGRERFANRLNDGVWIPVFTGMTVCGVRPSTGSAICARAIIG